MECDYQDGAPVGTGVKYYVDGGVYKGEFDPFGQPSGYGIWKYADGSQYEGQLKEGDRTGEGVMILADGTRLEGYFEHDVFQGGSAPTIAIDSE